jgi:hypothetical protein
MSAPELELRDALVAALAALSGMSAQRVVIGRPISLSDGPTPPVIWVAVGSAQDAFGPDLTSYQTTLQIDLFIAAPATASTATAREGALWELVLLVRDAVRGLGEPAGVTLLAAPLCSVTVEPQGIDTPGIALAVGVAQFVYWREAP